MEVNLYINIYVKYLYNCVIKNRSYAAIKILTLKKIYLSSLNGRDISYGISFKLYE